MSMDCHHIYVASSWRNGYYPEVVAKLREAGHDVYDFRNPPSGDPGFKWSSVSEDYMEWPPVQYRDMLQHPYAEGSRDGSLIHLVPGKGHSTPFGIHFAY